MYVPQVRNDQYVQVVSIHGRSALLLSWTNWIALSTRSLPFKVHNISVVNTSTKQERLTLKVLVTTIDAQWEGMGDVVSARYEPALLPPCPTIRLLSYSY